MNIFDIWFSRVEIPNNKKLEILSYYDPYVLFEMDRRKLNKLCLDDFTITRIQ